ncbi:response regulator transcription factor [Nitratifractor sp.]|uniref:response regulator transcription factor n=1 Tax=Nitratifractor sp. TaxID=2268144 RepID=UPI0025F02515|nr:response regulator transcription factor [Nitratifractor sp.]
MSATILILEDDRLFNETLCDFLEEHGYSVCGLLDPKNALEACYRRRFDLYLLDINLPFENGLNFLRSLRESGDETPAVFLTSREDRESLIEGFGIGADDYLRKPVDLEELHARIQATLRRSRGPMRFELDGYLVDRSRYRIYRDRAPVPIERKPFELLILLLQARGETVRTETIASTLWPAAQEASYGAIRVYVTRLKKLFGDRIENVRGVGYRLILDEEA